MKCPYCKKELNNKTIKIKELNIEVETEIHDKGKTLSEIEIPKGWRLLKVEEIIFLYNNYKEELNLEDTWEFIKQPFKFNKSKGYVAGFSAGSDWAILVCCGRNPDSRDGSLGVRFCKELKGDKK